MYVDVTIKYEVEWKLKTLKINYENGKEYIK